MKKRFSALLLVLLICGTVFTAVSCQKNDRDSYTFGVIANHIGQSYLFGDNSLGFDGFGDVKYKSCKNAKVGVERLQSGEIDLLLIDAAMKCECPEGFSSYRFTLTEKKGKTTDMLVICRSGNSLFADDDTPADVYAVLEGMKSDKSETSFDIFYKSFITNKGYEVAIDGLIVTLEIAVIGLLIGIVIGTLIATVKVMPKYRILPRILEKIVNIYVALFRGTPITVQLLIGYFVLLPTLDIHPDKIWVAIIVFGMNSGAYVSEIMRSGIQAVDIGQLEAARATGMGYPISMLKIVIPQAIKNILPTLGNEFITLIKDTSVVSFIAITDVTKAFRQIGDSTYEYVVPYLMLALVYLVLVGIIALLVKLLERRLKKNDRRH